MDFANDVEIQEIKFIYNNNYAYYSIINRINNKKYHGIIDIKNNLIVFNTDEDIITFTPYTNISMLAITKTNAYEVCIIKKDGKCIDSNDCSGSNHEFILDIEGNKCSNDCNSENNFCNVSCDKSIYIEINNSCVLCKDYYPDKPYKLIIGSICFSEEDIPEGEIYNSSLFLLRCKDGYVFEDETCILNTTNKSTSFPTTITKTIMTNNSTTITINDIITSMPKSVEIPSIAKNENEIFCSVNDVINDSCTEGKMILSDIDTIKNYLKNKGEEDEDSTIKTLKTRNVIIQFGSLNEQDANDKEVSNIDLGACEQELRTVYNISDNNISVPFAVVYVVHIS